MTTLDLARSALLAAGFHVRASSRDATHANDVVLTTREEFGSTATVVRWFGARSWDLDRAPWWERG